MNYNVNTMRRMSLSEVLQLYKNKINFITLTDGTNIEIVPDQSTYQNEENYIDNQMDKKYEENDDDEFVEEKVNEPNCDLKQMFPNDPNCLRGRGSKKGMVKSLRKTILKSISTNDKTDENKLKSHTNNQNLNEIIEHFENNDYLQCANCFKFFLVDEEEKDDDGNQNKIIEENPKTNEQNQRQNINIKKDDIKKDEPYNKYNPPSNKVQRHEQVQVNPKKDINNVNNQYSKYNQNQDTGYPPRTNPPQNYYQPKAPTQQNPPNNQYQQYYPQQVPPQQPYNQPPPPYNQPPQPYNQPPQPYNQPSQPYSQPPQPYNQPPQPYMQPPPKPNTNYNHNQYYTQNQPRNNQDTNYTGYTNYTQNYQRGPPNNMGYPGNNQVFRARKKDNVKKIEEGNRYYHYSNSGRKAEQNNKTECPLHRRSSNCIQSSSNSNRNSNIGLKRSISSHQDIEFSKNNLTAEFNNNNGYYGVPTYYKKNIVSSGNKFKKANNYQMYEVKVTKNNQYQNYYI